MKNDDDSTKALLWSYEIIVPNEMVSLEGHSYNALREKLAEHLDQLLTTDFNRLISILYRIDISQEKAMAALTENAQKETAGETLARLIIERQLDKIIIRRKYRNE
ncbi:MAG TPA: hypothetical protein VKX34_08220 [Aequorivita sp.]|nr:hypothetical protein [Aequorivita sp.]